MPTRRSMRRACWSTGPRSPDRPSCGAALLSRVRPDRPHDRREDADLCARPGARIYDAPVLRPIARDAAADDYRWSSLILAIVKSTPFQMRRTRIMIVTKKAIPRRTILRGLGAAVALPLLDGMVPAFTRSPGPPRRPSSASASSTCPTASSSTKWTPAAGRLRLRVHADSEAARAVSRSAARAERPHPERRRRDLEERRRARPLRDEVPDGRDSAAVRAGRRRLPRRRLASTR